MATNQLALLAAWHGIDAPAMRRVLRLFHEWLVDGGPDERRLGVEEFGVFYSQSQPARYIVREGKVFARPAVRVVKLRPSKVVVEQLTDDVDLAIEISMSTIGTMRFEREPGANHFNQTVGNYIPADERFDLVRSDTSPRRYCLIHRGFYPGFAFTAGHDGEFHATTLEMQFLRWDALFQALPNGLIGGNTCASISQTWSATPGPNGTGEEILWDAGALGRWCLAWLRSVTIAIDEVP